MGTSKSKWQYPALLSISVGFIILLIVLSSLNKLQLRLPIYFLILLVCDLAVTAFLTGWLRSKSEWTGPYMKGQLKLTGPVVVFLLILGAGYKFKPTPGDDPFDLTITLFAPADSHHHFTGDTLVITFGNLLRSELVNAQGQAIFLGVDPQYKGQSVHLLAKMDRFRISSVPDTLITIPNDASPSMRLPVYALGDSTLFEGLVLRRNQAKASAPIAGVLVHFTDFDKVVSTDSLGQFAVYLSARTGDMTSIRISKQQKWIFSGEMALSRNMQILADE